MTTPIRKTVYQVNDSFFEVIVTNLSNGKTSTGYGKTENSATLQAIEQTIKNSQK